MPQKVLQVHNRYLRPGGEDTVLREEFDLLRRNGHEVEQLLVANEDSGLGSALGAARTGLKSVWSLPGYLLMREALARNRPDIVHVHNTFPLLSPSVYWAARKAGVPVVQTLHNYRIMCANGLLMRDGVPCEDCVGRFGLSALRHRCYKGSLMGSGSLVAMQTVNRAIGSYRNQVDAYIALTEFAKSLMVRAGLPEKKVFVKPNFVMDSLPAGEPLWERPKQIVFVGTIDKQKGVDLLITAWAALPPHGYKLIIVGEGPERPVLERATADTGSIEWRGQRDRAEVLETVRQSRFLVMASRWYEGLPMVLLEALCSGTPAIVPRLGAMPEIIGQGEAGLMFSAGDVASLTSAFQEALECSEVIWRQKVNSARRTYLASYTPEANYNQLLKIYTAGTAIFKHPRGPIFTG